MTGPWTDEEIKQLEDPDYWDWDNPVEGTPSKEGGAIISVRFDRQQFRELAAEAERRGMKLTDLVREATLTGLHSMQAASPKATRYRTGAHRKPPAQVRDE